jgi:hypothetical protein
MRSKIMAKRKLSMRKNILTTPTIQTVTAVITILPYRPTMLPICLQR